MDCCSGTIEPDEIEIMEDPSTFEGVKRGRRCTDKSFIFAMATFFLILFGFLSYYMMTSDLDQILNGYDDCGNVCGKNNIKTIWIPFDCFGKNMEQKKYLLYGSETNNLGEKQVTKTCVENCDDHYAFVDFSNRCFRNSLKNERNITINSVFQSLADDFQMCWKTIILLSILALVFSVIMMVLMRYATAFLVWFSLIGIAVIFVGLSIYFWRINSEMKREHDTLNEEYGYIFSLCILTTVFAVTFLLIVLIMLKRIGLVIQLFKETAKAIADMPLLLFQPVLTFFALFFILFMTIYTTLLIMSSGYLVDGSDRNLIWNSNNPKLHDYVLSTFDMFVTWYNFIAVLWIIQFVIGCQHFIIAGSVSTWFFSRDKKNLGTPILTSTINLLKYHLGTVAVGSLIITTVQVVRFIIAIIKASVRKRNNIILSLIWCWCSSLVLMLEEFLKYFTRNAYILTATHGYSFCQSGKRALILLVSNIFKVTAINSVGDYVLFFIKIFVALLTVTIATVIFRQNDDIQNVWFPVTIVGCISYFIAHCFITVFEMAIDTIFLCFCEDCTHNDGVSKPYFMSCNLMEFVEKSNKTIKAANWDIAEQHAWDNGPKRVLRQPQ